MKRTRRLGARGTSRPRWQFFTVLLAAAFGLNWLAELAQAPAYAETARRSWQELVLPCTLASLGEAAVTLAVYVVAAPAAGPLLRGRKGKWKVYAAVALLGLACALLNEREALASGWRSYTGRMPVVPLLGVGLWPLLQPALLVPLALAIAAGWTRGGADRQRPTRAGRAPGHSGPAWAAGRAGFFRRTTHGYAERSGHRHG